MNKTYRVVWSAARQAYVVADERARARGKSSTLRTAVAAALLLPAASAFSTPVVCGASNNSVNTAITDTCELRQGASVAVTQNGSITPANEAPAIVVESGVTAGSITNEGALTITASSSGAYLPTSVIHIEDANLTGGIWNKASGNLLANGDGAGILVGGDSHIGGDIRNDGNITGLVGIAVSMGIPTGTEDVPGAPTVTGAIINTGSIVGQFGGIYVMAATLDGGINNSGSIDSQMMGLNLMASTINHGIRNDQNGTIHAQGPAVMVAGSTITGGLNNAGTIESEAGGAVMISASQVDFIRNEGDITGTSGLVIDNSEIGDVVNTKNITAIAAEFDFRRSSGGDSAVDIVSSTIANIRNDGAITGINAGISISSESSVNGIVNTGTIAGHNADYLDANGIYVGYDSAVTSIVNSGTISGDSAAVLAYGELDSIIISGNKARFIGDVVAESADVVLERGAVFENTNAFKVNSVNVEQGATFNLTEGVSLYYEPRRMPNPIDTNGITVSNGFNNAGTAAVAPGVVATIHGNYTQADSGTLSIGVAGDDSYGKLVVDGTATFEPNAKIFVDVKNAGYKFNVDSLRGVLTAETLASDGTFTVNDSSILFDFVAVKNENSIDLNLKKANFRQIVVGQGNNPAAGAASALDRIAGSGQFDDMLGFLIGFGSAQEFSNAVTQTLPLLTGASTQAASGALSSINRVIQARQDSNAGLSSGDGFLTDNHLWLKPFGSWADQDDRGGVAGYNADTMGFAIGSDAALNEKVRVGVAFAYAKADVDGASKLAPQSMDVDIFQLVGYGSYSLGSNTELNFQLDVGQNENSGKRYIGFANATAKSDYSSFNTHVGAGIGHTLSLRDGITFTPSARLDYTTIRDEGYNEKGAGVVGLNVSSNRTEELLASVDGKLNLKVTDNTSVALNVGAGYDVTNDRNSITAAYAGAPGFGFTTYGIEQNRWLLRSGVGLTHMADNGTEITARYDNESRSGFNNQTASLKVRWAF